MVSGKSALFSTGNDEWRTPPHIIKAVNYVLGFVDLDPCACPKSHVPAKRSFFLKDDGLSKSWVADTVFVNFPYSRANEWAAKIHEEYINGNASNILVLAAARTDTKWFHLLAEDASAILFFKGRIKFIPQDDSRKVSPTFPSVLLYLGTDPQKMDGLDKLGLVVRC